MALCMGAVDRVGFFVELISIQRKHHRIPKSKMTQTQSTDEHRPSIQISRKSIPEIDMN